MAVQDVNKGGSLAKGSTISFKKLVVTLISNATPADTIRDTLIAGSNGFSAKSTDSQSVSRSYSVKPLRNWTITVKTLDTKDSVIHSATVAVANLLAGETRSLELKLTSRFVMYIAQFILPDSLRAVGTTQAQVLNVNRLTMVVDGITVVDSVKASGYFTAGAPHTIQYDYVKSNSVHTLELYVFGVLPGWPVEKPLYGDTLTVAPGSDTTYTPQLPWLGPGSNVLGMEIQIGKVGSVILAPEISGTIYPKQR
jgi:hypothetical protein